ncbi:MAG: endonuclease [Chitinophagaceae bacterium]|nr:endonuclease [Chitinophagaceae bacterium]
MPEGPSIVILKEALQAYKGKKVLSATGNAKIELGRIEQQKIMDFKSWGKHFLICFKGFYLRIHLLMFGSYAINERKDRAPRLSLEFAAGEINFYTCSIKLIDGDPNQEYDWEVDVMADEWNASKAEKIIKLMPEEKVCDVLLNQAIFSGVGNIIKNEVLFLARIHPESLLGALPAKKRKELIKLARSYSFDFYTWKKAFVLKKHWQIYKKKICPRCNIPVETAYLGKTKRLTCYCSNCQYLYYL